MDGMAREEGGALRASHPSRSPSSRSDWRRRAACPLPPLTWTSITNLARSSSCSLPSQPNHQWQLSHYLKEGAHGPASGQATLAMRRCEAEAVAAVHQEAEEAAEDVVEVEAAAAAEGHVHLLQQSTMA